jgi:hypothetical protein
VNKCVRMYTYMINRCYKRTHVYTYVFLTGKSSKNTHTHSHIDSRIANHHHTWDRVLIMVALYMVFIVWYVDGLYAPLGDIKT